MTAGTVARAISVLVLAGVMTGCVNLAPDHVQPPLPTPVRYEPDYFPFGGVSASEVALSSFFPDPRLERLLASALANNRNLVAATARIEQARARYAIEDSRRLPTVAAAASAIRSRTPLTGGLGAIGTGDGGVGDPSAPDVATPSSVTLNRFDVGVGISSFELDFWGRVANLSEAARAQYLATIGAQRAFYLSLIGDVAANYYQLIEAQERVELARQTAESRAEGLRIAQLRLDAGVTSALPLRQAESLLTQAQQELVAQRLQAAQFSNNLQVLVGGRFPDDLPAGLLLAEQNNQLRLEPGLPSALLLQRPDIFAAEEQLRASRANIGAARAAFFPTISLTGTAGLASDALGGLFEKDGFTWSFGPGISLPIFDAGARRAQVDLALAQEAEQLANYDLTVQNAFREVSDALAGRRWLTEQIEAQERGLEALRQIAHIAQLRYREGVADYLEVLDAERNLFAAQQQLLATRSAYLRASVNLYVALGGGLPQ
ncbi:efflux transporter outer membrane subunit [Croceicoccus sp. F390]|uniref:Efflux transporter outer membrane subunit n=1 Tax=Croceicoccus esteveae TaxID=3075597 RepID=A0ABU2ZHJ6_9SPHN|nr:efflux transporter outer membrane subunit [Croceicoccus sp. F390]MDT0576065.1 efflux transporter outer membrane subunit [Croceicoccus sp. F390]